MKDSDLLDAKARRKDVMAPTREWPRFAAAALGYSMGRRGDRVFTAAELAERVAGIADALDAEWQKRTPASADSEQKAYALGCEAGADYGRREERERVLDAVWHWLWSSTDNSTPQRNFQIARAAGRFDPPEGKP